MSDFLSVLGVLFSAAWDLLSTPVPNLPFSFADFLITSIIISFTPALLSAVFSFGGSYRSGRPPRKDSSND